MSTRKEECADTPGAVEAQRLETAAEVTEGRGPGPWQECT